MRTLSMTYAAIGGVLAVLALALLFAGMVQVAAVLSSVAVVIASIGAALAAVGLFGGGNSGR